MELNHTHIDTFNRLSLGLIEKHGVSPQDAIAKLEQLRLFLVCGVEVARSIPLQAALLTAINSGKRAFLGGVTVQMDKKITCFLPWPGKKLLYEIAIELGATVLEPSEKLDKNANKLVFGSSTDGDYNDQFVICNDWQAGILTHNDALPFPSLGDIPTAGIFAGALGVSRIFFKQSGIDITACDKSAGISLWRPDLNWLDAMAKGPKITTLPKKYWLLGLGHLGQAYSWNIGLLPYGVYGKQTTILLHDDDRIVPANQSAGLLAEDEHTNMYKTRRCASWLEERGLVTQIIERRFDEHTKRYGEEPFLAFCGFDSAISRMHLEKAGFDLIVESGLGNNLATFDRVSIHTFPNSLKTAEEIWSGNSGEDINQAVLDVLGDLDQDEKCGIVSRTISGKAVSASFVGACTGALIIAEALRGLHEGLRYDKIVLQLRDLSGLSTTIHNTVNYSLEMGRNGSINISC